MDGEGDELLLELRAVEEAAVPRQACEECVGADDGLLRRVAGLFLDTAPLSPVP
ncbi:hypothetical protein AB0M61_28000 [Streptomyces sp. NPDC051642]|uniref:hypothetical protein n=1 Tax=Streptomyces sp. NPDC051642 TaxID=3154646 RepID=UPI00343B37C2